MAIHAAPTRTTTAMPAITAAPAVLLQRTCDCGQHALGREQCDGCKKKKLTLHRRATNSFSPRSTPGIVHDVLRSSGQPLDTATRSFMEPRFGCDFGQIRIHTDARASESARAVSALAYTVNDHIVFQQGNYNPASPAGRRLLAHELTHVVQNRIHAGHIQAALPEISNPADSSEREATDVAERIVRGETADVAQASDAFVHRELDPIAQYALIGLGVSAGVSLLSGIIIGSIYGAGVFITDEQLQKYLRKLDETNRIEGGSISDMKARRVADSWGKGETKFVLTIRRRALLVLEMLDGHVSHWDKDGIMNILERSGDADLDYIFGPGGVSHQKLIAALDDWKDEVKRFYSRRYGIDDIYQQKDFSSLKALRAGPIQPGDPLPQAEIDDPLKITERRTKPVTREESDDWITEAYSKYLAGDKAKGDFIDKNVDIHETESDFKEGLEPDCNNQKAADIKQKEQETGKQVSKDDEEIKKKYDRCINNTKIVGVELSPQKAGKTKAQIYLRETQSASTLLHEALHAYSDPVVSNKTRMPQFAMEGATEYFTRQIAMRHNVAIGDVYDGPFLVMQEFSLQFGEDTLAQVYFQGKTELLCSNLVERFGTGAYNEWAKAMAAEESWMDALKVMKRPKPAKRPDSTECSSTP